MTIATTLKKFEILKNAILKDGKVDPDEVVVLLDFIAPYCQASNKKFLLLKEILVKSIEDDKIDEDESECIIAKINDVEDFLKTEKKVETIMSYVLGIILLSMIFVLVFN